MSVTIINASGSINCYTGRVAVGGNTTQQWTPNEGACPADQTLVDTTGLFDNERYYTGDTSS
jgi:hypothetical protein